MALVDKLSRRVKKYRRACDRWLWNLRNESVKHSKPVYIFGAQRSGTTMLVDCFRQSPAFDVYGEISEAFEAIRIKDTASIGRLLDRSRRGQVVFKPLADSHRVADLMSAVPGAKAIWMYRQPEDRANSAVNRFGDTNLRFLRELAAKGPTDRWEALGVSPESIELMKSLQPECMDPLTAAVAFWTMRNQLFFDQQLDANPDVLLVRYEKLASQPEETMQGICRFLDCSYDARLTRNIHARSIGRREISIAPAVADIASQMLARLDSRTNAQWSMLTECNEPRN